MRVSIEFPAEDRFETALNAEVKSSDGKSLFLIGDTFFVEIDSMKELAYHILELSSEEDDSVEDK